jgi:hypothetical protein
MSEIKMGTNYAREIAEDFRKAAPECKNDAVKQKLVSLAAELDQFCTKLYFKTQKGTEEMQALGAKVAGLGSKMAGFDAAAADSFCTPICSEIERILQHVKTMKVRMT